MDSTTNMAEHPNASSSASSASSADSVNNATSLSPTFPPRAKRQMIKAACDTCRRNKQKCCGERPACLRCRKTGKTCFYPTLPGETRSQASKRDLDTYRGRANAHEEVFLLLKNLPQRQALDYLRHIRSGVDADQLLNHARTADPRSQASLVPHSRMRYVFPRDFIMPVAYTQGNPYNSACLVYEGQGLFSVQNGQVASNVSSAQLVISPSTPEHYLKPFHAAHVEDPLITDIRPSLWTNVCKDDALMRSLLRTLFLHEYTFQSIFQKDLFLEDMIHMRHDFCSPLLVNVALAYACVTYSHLQDRAEYWNPGTFMYQFIAEAKRLWELEAGRAVLTNVHAGLILNLIHNYCGLDKIGYAYREHAIRLAKHLKLFAGPILGNDERIRRGWIYTAWSVFSWESLSAFSFRQEPLLKNPPVDPLPMPLGDPFFYGNIWLRYPDQQSLIESHFGELFRAKAHFRIIMNSFCDNAYAPDSGVGVTREAVYNYYSELTAWFDGLPPSLQAKTICLPAHLQLHMYYYILLLHIFEPLVDLQTSYRPTPQRIVEEANIRLLTLLQLYYLRHGYDAMDLFIVIPLVDKGYKTLDLIKRTPDGPELEFHRATLMLVATGLYNQRRNHYLAEALYRVIRSKMRPEEYLLLKGVADLADEKDVPDSPLRQEVRSQWPISVVRTQEEADALILTNLVEGLEIA